MSRMLQISESDLAELESTLPLIVDRLYPQMDNRLRSQVRRIQRVLTDVRWNYGPPREVEAISEGAENVDG